MRKKPSMMQPTNFTDFNPLDVLAAAASLQRRTEETDDGENENHKTGSGASAEEEEDTQEGGEDEDGGAAKTVTCEVAAPQALLQQPQDAGQCDQTVPDTPAPQHGGTEAGTAAHGESAVVDVTHGALRVSGAAVTAKAKTAAVTSAASENQRSVPITPPPVPRMVGGTLSNGRPQLTDHSYAFVSQLQSLRADEDEGYSSRSSLDDDSEETVSRLNHKNGQYLTGWGGRPVSSLIGHTAKTAAAAANSQQQAESEQSSQDSSRSKATKIVILSKDSKLQRIISGINGEGNQLSGSSSGSSLMLRTLLGQKAALKGNAQGQNKVIIAGGLSGRVINVLKSGSISLAPPEGGPQQDTATPNDGTPLEVSDEAVGDNKDAVCSSVSEPAACTDPVSESAVSSPCTVDTQPEEALSEQQLSAEVSTELSQCDSLETRSSEENVAIPSMADIQKHSSALSEVSSRHGSEVVTEDETSCDSSKDDMTVDTTPVMSPCADFTSPLMSPVSERDVPMMSPTVGSPEIMCDIFKLPSCIKYQIPSDTSVLREGQSKVTVNCVINEEAASVFTDPQAVTDEPSDESVNVTEEQATISPAEQTTDDCSSLQEQQQTGEVGIEGALITTNCDDDDPSSGSAPQIMDITPHSETDQQQHSESEALGTEATESEYSQEQVSPEDSSTKLESIAPVDEHPECETQPQGPVDDAQIAEDVSDTHEPEEDLPLLGITETQKSGTPDPSGTARNQYIIEDDESPVAKFGTPRSSTDDDGLSSECSSPMALAVPASGAHHSGQQQPLTQTDVSVEKTSPAKVPVSGTDSIKVIMTTEASNKSVFTAVRRPLMSGMKALPGSLHMVPVVSSSKSGVMHVVPVSGARGVVTQIIPKPGSQFITGVPVLSGKTVVLPDNSKGRMNTILVPVSMASSSTAAPISLVQTSKVKLANLQQQQQQAAVKTEPVETVPLSSLQRPELSSPLIFHGRITPVSVMSDTSELLSSPESSLHGGFSGVIMGGRSTPDMPDTPRPPSRTSLENSKDKISIKISSNSVMESDDSMSSEAGFSVPKKETIGIGMMGSLSWKHIDASSGRGLTQIGTGGAGREYVRIQGGELRTGFQASDEDSMPALEKPVKKPGRVPKSHDGKGVYNRKKNKLSAADSGIALPPPTVSDQYTPSVAQLHPLIDHDYCMFTEFNAQIQSSIIATTESKTKIEKKYAKKTKAVRTKAVRGLITEESFKSVSKAAVEKIINKGRRGRLKKRRASKEKAPSDEEISLDGTEELDEIPTMTVVEEKPRKIVELKPSRTSERRAKLQALKDDKNYVKITGSYQDEFVYFATKNKRNRPRKSIEDKTSQLTKQPQVGGMTVFDWYKDLSKADKTSRFGTPTTSGPSSPVPGFITHSGDTEVRAGIASVVGAHETLQSTSNTSTSASLNPNLNSAFRPAAAPIHESEVAELVCDLEINGLGHPASTGGAPVNDMDLSSFMIAAQDIKSEQTVAAAPDTDPSSPAGVIPPVSMAEMAEQVREMLNSMGADELENLELKFGDVDPATVGLTDTSFDGLLGGFTQEEVAITSQATTNNLCDLDEINDSDLLQSDLGLLGDVKPTIASTTNTLKPSASAPSLLLPGQGERLPSPAQSSSFGFSKTLEFGGMRLDKTELFPDMAPPPPPPADVSTLAANTAPELTLVSMYWNDLPGLVLMGQQYVRLVDIHKQVLPAKDTGILKKRCQMMGLSIANCSELQRDFLVRYANAAKSKSTVIVSKDAAQTLIGFYVEPKSRPSKQSVEERGIQLAEQARAQAAAAAATKAAAEGATTSADPVDLQSESAASSPAPSPMALGGRKVTVKASPGIRRKRRSTGGSLSDGSPVPPGAAGDVKRSARLRHKNVSYSDMLLGNHYDNQERKDDMSPTPTPPPSVMMENQQNLVTSGLASGLQEKEPTMSEGSQENKETERMLFPEDIEIKKLKIKMRLKCLNAKEKRRLRRLREKVRKREMKRKLRERRKLDRTNGRKKASVMAAALANIVKTKKKLQETHMFNKKYNQEHCYAAAPVSPDKKEPVKTMASSTNISVTDERIPTSVEEVQSSTQLTVITPVVVKTEAVEDVEMTPVEAVENTPPTLLPVKVEKKEVVTTPLRKETTVKSHSPPRVQPKVEKVTREERAVAVEKPKVEKVKAKDVRPVTKTVSAAAVHRVVHRPPVAVLHRDAVQRLSQRSRWQDGQLYVDRFTDRQAVCISCTTCSEFFSVKRFLKHMHHQNNRDELAHVTLSQTLELRAGDSATAEERTIWAHFEKLREKLMGPVSSVSNNSTPRRARPASIPPSPPIQLLTNKTTASAFPVTSKSTTEAKGRSPVSVAGTSKTGKNSPAAVSRAVAKAVSAATVVVNNRTAALNSSAGQSAARAAHKQVPSASAPPKVRDTSSASGPTLVTSSAPLTSSTVGKGATARTVTSPGTSRRDRVMAVAAKTRTLLANASRALTKTAETSVATTTPQLRRVSHPPAAAASPTLVRHSTRVRKQKQLHPIEKYVFSSGVSPPVEPPPAKRPRLSAGEREPVLSLLASAAGRGVLTSPSAGSSSSSTTCGRKVRLRLSTGGTTAKYDLRAPSESGRQ